MDKSVSKAEAFIKALKPINGKPVYGKTLYMDFLGLPY